MKFQSLKSSSVFYAVIMLVFLSQFVHGQMITVKEYGSEEPIAGVVLYNQRKSKSVVTDINGKVSIDVFSEDEMIFFQNFLYKKAQYFKGDIIKQNFVVYLELTVEDLNQIVISATKFEQSKKDVPQTIVSLSARDIAMINPQTSADMLEGTGNIFVQKSQLGGGSPIIRGFSTNRLLITVDGVRMNNAIFRGGNLQNVISIDPFTIQNTEVTLGAGSVVYGSDAIGGVMGFYTKKPQLSYKEGPFFNAQAVLRYASANDESTGHIDFNLGYKKWGFLSSISYNSFNDLRMGTHGPEDYLRDRYAVTTNGEDIVVNNPDPKIQTPTGYDQINLMQKVRYEPLDNLNFDLGLYYSSTSEFSRYDRLLRPLGDGLRSAEWNYGPQRWFMSNLTLTKLSSSSNLYDKIQSNLAYQRFDESRYDRDLNSVIRNRTAEQVDAISFNLDIEKNLTSKTKLFYGMEYLFNKIHSSGSEENIEDDTISNALSRYPVGSTWQSAALYSSFKYKPNERFIFQSGIRYNHVLINADFRENNVYLNLPFNTAKINTGAITGTAGVTYNPSERLQWRFNASTAFRAPNIDDIGKVFDSEPGSVVVPNNNLKSEYAYGGELGLTLNFNNAVKLDFATYYTFLDNALTRRDFELNGEIQIEYNGELSNVQAIQNAAKAWIYGFELGAEINFSKSLKLTTQYNIIGGSEEDDNGVEVPVRHVAPYFGNTHFLFKNEKLTLDAFAVYNNELSFNELAPSEISKDYIYAQDANGNPYAPSWYTLNFRASYDLSTHLKLTSSLENITDQRYRPYSSGIAAPGRNLILSVTYFL